MAYLLLRKRIAKAGEALNLLLCRGKLTMTPFRKNYASIISPFTIMSIGRVFFSQLSHTHCDRYSERAMQLMKSMLVLDASQRPSAQQVADTCTLLLGDGAV